MTCEIKTLTTEPETCVMLSDLLIETVANGGSVSFMHPLAPETATAFWDNALAEALAVERGRTLLTLDTATEGGASGLYERLGFTLAGIIPDYALKPHGGLTGTMIYWKQVGQKPE